MKKIYTLLATLFAIAYGYSQFNPGYYQTVTVIENYGDNVNDYVALLEVNTATPVSNGRMNSNGNDIRFGNGCSSNYYDYWIASGMNTSNTRIYVRIPSIGANDSITFWMMYGDANAVAMSSFSSTFPNAFISSGNATISGTKNYGWIEVSAGDTIFLGNNTLLDIRAAYAKIEGAVIGNGKGFAGGTSGPTSGSGPGGGGGSSNAGSGGGGYGGAGGLGGFDSGDSPGAGGNANGAYNSLTINKGSGGGAGSACNGGNGGGGFALKSRIIDVSGDIFMNGLDGTQPGCAQGGGGGSGGGILLAGDSVIVNNSMSAVGGNGSVGTSTANDDGGGGGGGRIKMFHGSSFSNSGTRIVTSGAGGPNGSTPAQNGSIGTVFDTTHAFINPIIGNQQVFPGPPPPTQTILQICLGDSVMLGGAYRKTMGNYIDTLQNSTGCDSVVETSLTVLETDTSFTVSGTTLTAVPNSTGQSYQWLECDSTGYTAIPGATGTTYTVTANGSYGLAVSNFNCNDTSSCVTFEYVGLESWENKSAFNIYPNPFDDAINVQIDKNIDRFNLKILDLNGKELFNSDYSNENKIQLNTSTFPKGIYVIHIQSEKTNEVLKLIKK